MLRKIAIAAAMVMATVVLAQGLALIGARGQGAAVSEDHRVAEFRFHVSKLTSQPPRLSGEFNVHIGGRDHRNVSIELRNVRNVAVGGDRRNVCEFQGGAVMRVRTHQGVETVEGILSVRVVDAARRDDDSVSDGEDHDRPDLIQLTFRKPNTNIEYNFAGRVREGDIDVFVRTR